jgi:hypothetical protein
VPAQDGHDAPFLLLDVREGSSMRTRQALRCTAVKTGLAWRRGKRAPAHVYSYPQSAS